MSKNKKYQYTFFCLISFVIIFNGGNSNLIIQLNFIFLSIFFLFCLKDKNYFLHLRNFLFKNKNSIYFFILFMIFLVFQIIYLPENILKYFSYEKYKYINLFENVNYGSISLNPLNSYFQILNFLALLLVIFINKMILYTNNHLKRFYIFLSFVGFLSSFVAVFFFLNGNTDFLIFQNSFYSDSSTGFFINRTVFSIFLLFCFISCVELLKIYQLSNSKKDYFILKIYVRLFLIFITIGIITSFSRIGNFLLLITIFFYLINEIVINKLKNKSFLMMILFLIVIDLVILGFYFGASQLIDRFYFLNEELGNSKQMHEYISRFKLINFSLQQINNFLFFGYGSGSYETLFQLNYINPNNKFANHAHSDLLEFFGEFGLIGFSLFLMSFFRFLIDKKNYHFVNIILFTYLSILLIFDFSLHIPIIQILFIIFFSFSGRNYGSSR